MHGAVLVAHVTSGLAGQTFTRLEVFALMAFAVDLVLGPVSALVLLLALGLRSGSRAWRPVLGVVAVLNLLVTGVMLAGAGGGLGRFVALVWLQLLVALALLAVVLHAGASARLFGAKRPRLTA